MTAGKKSVERRVSEALASEEPYLPSLEEALDDGFGARFEIPTSLPGLRVAGNWNQQAEEEMEISMGLLEAVLQDEDGNTRAHARGFVMSRPGVMGPLGAVDAVDAADTVNDTYMAAMMAMVSEGAVEGAEMVLVVVGHSGATASDKRQVISGMISAVKAWEDQLSDVGLLVSVELDPLERISVSAGVTQDVARPLIEDILRTELFDLALPEEVALHLLSVEAMSFEESLMALGRFYGGEQAETILAAPTSGEGDDILYGAAKMPVPFELLIEFRRRLEGQGGDNVQRLGEAMRLANAYVVATGAAPLGVAPQDGVAINSTSMLIATSLHMRIMAFEMALQDPQIGQMLEQLRNADRVIEVFETAANAPLDPGIGSMPFFLPEFREKIEDMIMSER